MKLVRFLLGALLLLLIMAGCTAIRPLSSMVNEEYIAKPDRFEIVGDIQGEATIAVLFGFIPLSNNAGYLRAYQNALENARDKGADGLIGIYSDVKYFSVLGFYKSCTTVVYATAIKRKP